MIFHQAFLLVDAMPPEMNAELFRALNSVKQLGIVETSNALIITRQLKHHGPKTTSAGMPGLS